MQTLLSTLLALMAFAANSILCRLALQDGAIDPASFSTIRLAAGAGALALITARSGPLLPLGGSWTSAGMLFSYAVPFSFAYAQLAAGTGALILFGTVQITMVSAALATGERPHARHWLGLTSAVAGLVILVRPGLAAPSSTGAVLMAVAGVAWGAYSLAGRGTTTPLAHTAGNFARTLPLTLAVSLIAIGSVHIEPRGAALAIASGAIASGLGYVVWYTALPRLTRTRAALVQLAVPVLAAAGGVLLLGEAITSRLAVATALVVGGIGLALSQRE